MTIQILFGLLGGLGLFVFGMQKMAEGLQNAAGDKLKRILELFTSHPVIAILTGAAATILVQSSSTTTVIVVGLVNTGLLTLTQAVGTIMGANIGTTITAQIVSFNIYVIALPILGIAGMIHFLSRKKSVKYIALSFFGFGMIMLGMNIMSDSVIPLREYPPFLEMLVSMGQQPLLGVIAGCLFTALIQSSMATTSLVLAFSLQGLIDLPSAIAIILGANIGTCITAFLASIGTGLTAKRAAAAHIFFNFFGVIIFIILLKPFTLLVSRTSTNIVRQIANAHTMFNIINTIIFFPFINQFVKFIEWIIPGEEKILEFKPKYLDPNIVHTPAALLAASKETLRMCDISLEMMREAFDSFIDGDEKLIESVLHKEDVLNELEKKIIFYLTEAGDNPWTTKQHQRITNLLHLAHEIERVGDLSTNIVELSQSRINRNLKLSDTAVSDLTNMYQLVESIYIRAIEVFRNERIEDARNLIREDDIVDQMEKEYRESHIERLNAGKCHPETGVLFLDIISHLERIADHANNLAEAVSGVLLNPVEVEV